MAMFEPKLVTPKDIIKLFDSATEDRMHGYLFEPRGLFYCIDTVNRRVIAVDNSTGNAWTEEFSDLESALAWLNGEELEEVEK